MIFPGLAALKQPGSFQALDCPAGTAAGQKAFFSDVLEAESLFWSLGQT